MTWYKCETLNCQNKVSIRRYFCGECCDMVTPKKRLWNRAWGHWKEENDELCQCCNYDSIFKLTGAL